VGVERVGLGEHGIVAALAHAGAARASEETLDDHRDGEMGRMVRGVQRGAEAGAARSEDQDVRLDEVDGQRSRLARRRFHEVVQQGLLLTTA